MADKKRRTMSANMKIMTNNTTAKNRRSINIPIGPAGGAYSILTETMTQDALNW